MLLLHLLLGNPSVCCVLSLVMAGKRKYACSSCGNSHLKPIGFTCEFVDSESESSPKQSPIQQTNPAANDGPTTSNGSASSQGPVLAAITPLGSKSDDMERHLTSTKEQLKAAVSIKMVPQSGQKYDSQDKGCRMSDEEEEDLVIPSLRTIRKNQLLKEQVDARLEQLRRSYC